MLWSTLPQSPLFLTLLSALKCSVDCDVILIFIVGSNKKWRGTKKPLNESERGEWKIGLKLNIQKTKIMGYGPITSWQIDGETMETVRDFILGGSKITAEGDWSHEIKRHLLLGRKAMSNLDSILKSRDITLPPSTSREGILYVCEESSLCKMLSRN